MVGHQPLAILLLLGGCATLGGRPAHLRWTVLNGDDTLTQLVFVGDHLGFERHGFLRRRRAAPDVAAKLHSLLRDPAWHHELAKLRHHYDPATTAVGGLTFVLETSGPGGMTWARVPADEIPDSLRPFLASIDDAFAKTFPRSYEELWSSARLAPDPLP